MPKPETIAIEVKRSCYSCELFHICHLKETLMSLGWNFNHTDEAPGNLAVVFIAIGNACLEWRRDPNAK